MNRERQYFDPESIHLALATNLVDGLRALADAIEAKEIDGRFISAKAHGFFARNDDRAHIVVAFDVNAQIYATADGPELLPRPTLHLPSPETKGLSK